ncbi:class I SAM-dependent methyltransferase [Tistlia consotensis]|uniref:Ubiquinone/menaquinone biosynthesis C-methylase UbiE n=1 Tax=Tistlia consotensis USBA 355 TaxID=560819 RepID=A0A1Y6CVZ7_9PROT|nr:class I SAM-dependent methyltransferase [Tistlia consotensis]SMF82836.1 Ubiquinone/menaquinone biosynthesis C-methylase UbiE [Tistlia consotensis USBA 355]
MDLYEDTRLTAVYDLMSPPAEDTAFYRRLAGGLGNGARLDVLDLGCGTGQLALALADDGHRVTGYDPAPAMLAIARAKPGAERVTWRDGAAEALPDAPAFDLAVMTGHVFQVLLSDKAIAATLAALRRCLRPGGRLAFESRNPLFRSYLTWTPEQSREILALPGGGPDGPSVEIHNDVTPLVDERLTYETHFHFPDSGERFVTRNDLRFAPQPTIARLLAEAGFGPVAWQGDWQGNPFTEASREIIAVATAP